MSVPPIDGLPTELLQEIAKHTSPTTLAMFKCTNKICKTALPKRQSLVQNFDDLKYYLKNSSQNVLGIVLHSQAFTCYDKHGMIIYYFNNDNISNRDKRYLIKHTTKNGLVTKGEEFETLQQNIKFEDTWYDYVPRYIKLYKNAKTIECYFGHLNHEYNRPKESKIDSIINLINLFPGINITSLDQLQPHKSKDITNGYKHITGVQIPSVNYFEKYLTTGGVLNITITNSKVYVSLSKWDDGPNAHPFFGTKSKLCMLCVRFESDVEIDSKTITTLCRRTVYRDALYADICLSQQQLAETIDIDEDMRFVVNKTFKNGPRKTYLSTWFEDQLFIEKAYSIINNLRDNYRKTG